MMGGGLFNTKLHGTGWVAVLTDGPPVRLDVSQAATCQMAFGGEGWVLVQPSEGRIPMTTQAGG